MGDTVQLDREIVLGTETYDSSQTLWHHVTARRHVRLRTADVFLAGYLLALGIENDEAAAVAQRRHDGVTYSHGFARRAGSFHEYGRLAGSSYLFLLRIYTKVGNH